MERRDLLKLGAATALVGCVTSRPTTFAAVPPPPIWTPEEVQSALADMDATLGKLATSTPKLEEFGAVRKLDEERVARGHDLTVRTLAAMHVAATFRELPAEVRSRDDVQRRMWGALPFIDEAMLDMSEYVAGLSASERRAIQEKLRADPAAGMEVIAKLDEHAAAAKVPNRRRMQMRAIATHTSWRMTRQSVDALLDDTLDKVRRVRERHGHDEQLQRAVGAKVAEAALFGVPHSHLVLASGVPGARHNRHHGAGVVLGVGGVMLGVGAVGGGMGGVLLAIAGSDGGLEAAGLVSITVGAALGLAGIILLIVGAVMMASANASEPESGEGD